MPQPANTSVEQHPELTRRHLSRLRSYFQHRRPARGERDSIDLDLLRVGALNYIPLLPGHEDGLAVTSYGANLLANATAQARAERAPHHELGARLGAWLREQGRLVWENIEFRVDTDNGGRLARPDVFSLLATHNEKRIAPTVHEVKVSRADFLSDLRHPVKLAAYRAIASHIYFACPEGLIRREELPAGYGLLYERADGTWSTVKRPRKSAVQLSTWHWMNLLLKHGRS